MNRTTAFRFMIALPLALPLAFVDAASAAQLSYQQAWAQCRQDIPANAASGACMRTYGYRLRLRAYNAMASARGAAVYGTGIVNGSGAYGYGGSTSYIGNYLNNTGDAWRDEQLRGNNW